jgi:hypothetical protein
LGLIHPPDQWVPAGLSAGIKRQGREADHSPACNVDVKNGGAAPLLPHTYSWCGAYLIKPMDNFTILVR